MKLTDLIETLTMLQSDLEAAGIDPTDTDVRLMHQPSWPFEYSISGVSHTTLMNQYKQEYDGEEREQEGPEIVYICEGSQLGYGDKDAWEATIV